MSLSPPCRHPSRDPFRGWRVRVLTAAFVAAPILTLLSCGDSGPPTGVDSGIVDTLTLAGTWRGSVNGTDYGYSVLTTILNADSTMTSEGENPNYCKLTGTWTVSGANSEQYTSRGRICDGSIVTSTAPFHKRIMTGTWSSSNGRSGTFTITKQ